MTTSEHSEPGKPLAVPLSDQLGLVVDATVLDCWKANYGLEKTPAEIAATWGNWAPTGAILALRAAVAEIERQRRTLREIAEEWAGAECGEPVHAQEAYAIGLAKRMYALAVDGLKA